MECFKVALGLVVYHDSINPSFQYCVSQNHIKTENYDRGSDTYSILLRICRKNLRLFGWRPR